MLWLICRHYKKALYQRVLVLGSSFILIGHSPLHASSNNTNIREESVSQSKLSTQSSVIGDNFLIQDFWHSHETFKEMNYTLGEFSFEYDDLTNTGFTPDYQGEGNKTDSLIVENQKNSQGQKGLIVNLENDTPFKWPDRIHGHIAIQYSNGNLGNGSGILIGPNHVLTAAHNLYDRGGSGWVKQIRFAPGRHHDEYQKGGDAKGCILLVPKQWKECKSANKEYEKYDYGIVILDSPIGLLLGWSGLLSLPGELLQGVILSLTGYPGDKGTHEPHLIQTQKDYGTVKKVQGDQLLYDIKTYKGQSGGAIYVQQFPGYKGMYTIGVHTYGKEKEGEEYRGSYLTGEKVKLLVACLKTYQCPNVGSFIPQLKPENLPSTKPFITEAVRRDYESWARGAESGNKEDLYHIGTLYREGKNGIPKDNDNAYAFFYQAAQDDGNKKGYIPALTALGAWYEQYGERHLLKAISLYQKARSKNNAEAIRRLGLLYLEGKGLPKQVQTAESLLKEAGEKGDGEAYYHLARLYEEGRYVTLNQEYAVGLYGKAQKLGYKFPPLANSEREILINEQENKKVLYQKGFPQESILPIGRTDAPVRMTVFNDQLFIVYGECEKRGKKGFTQAGKIFLSRTLNGFEWEKPRHILKNISALSQYLSICQKDNNLYLLVGAEDSYSSNNRNLANGIIVNRFLSTDGERWKKLDQEKSKIFLDEPLEHMTIDLSSINIVPGRDMISFLSDLHAYGALTEGPWYKANEWLRVAKESKYNELLENILVIPSFATINHKTYVSFIRYPYIPYAQSLGSPQIMLAERVQEKGGGFSWSLPYSIHQIDDEAWALGETRDKILAVSMVAFKGRLYIAYQDPGLEQVCIAYSKLIDQWGCNDGLHAYWKTYLLPFTEACTIPTLLTFKNYLLLSFVDNLGNVHMSCSETGKEKSWVFPQVWKKA